ncbi:hypothetical protein RND81_05G201600 [Saponaria officinalis]|uniref:IBB domain-containing protein n=1 Tax=Saponaria officinalis TaxID=3572 RepID=A0AAW1KYR0_SAPOF
MSLRPNARKEVRRSRYKVAVDADEGCQRREDNMVEIRKNCREENLQGSVVKVFKVPPPPPPPLSNFRRLIGRWRVFRRWLPACIPG